LCHSSVKSIEKVSIEFRSELVKSIEKVSIEFRSELICQMKTQCLGIQCDSFVVIKIYVLMQDLSI